MALPLFDAGLDSAELHPLLATRLAFPPELQYLVVSAQPAVVFTSLADLSVPVISDTCAVEITEDDDNRYSITCPHLPVGPKRIGSRQVVTTRPRSGPAAQYTVRTWVDVLARDGHLGYHGHVTHTWTGNRPASGDVARATGLVRHAIRVIRYERHTLSAEPHITHCGP